MACRDDHRRQFRLLRGNRTEEKEGGADPEFRQQPEDTLGIPTHPPLVMGNLRFRINPAYVEPILHINGYGVNHLAQGALSF